MWSISISFQTVEIVIEYINLGSEGDIVCTNTALEIWDAATEYGTDPQVIVQTLCGQSVHNSIYRSRGVAVKVKLRTNGGGAQGFVFSFKRTMKQLIGNKRTFLSN